MLPYLPSTYTALKSYCLGEYTIHNICYGTYLDYQKGCCHLVALPLVSKYLQDGCVLFYQQLAITNDLLHMWKYGI